MTMQSYRKLFAAVRFVVMLGLCAALAAGPGWAQGLVTLDSILQAHGVKPGLFPSSVEMTGIVERAGKSEPFRLVATGKEELRIDYGTAGKDKLVASQKVNFHDDGVKVAYQKVPSGFSQLDVTGLFLVGQLRTRNVRVEPTSDRLPIAGALTQRILVQNERHELHKGTLRVEDRVDLYVTEAGLLAGVSRHFYAGRPERYTQAFTFTEYRKTEDVMLPYRIEVFIKGQRRQTFLIERYRFDVLTDSETFIPRRAQ